MYSLFSKCVVLSTLTYTDFPEDRDWNRERLILDEISLNSSNEFYLVVDYTIKNGYYTNYVVYVHSSVYYGLEVNVGKRFAKKFTSELSNNYLK